MEVVTLTNVSFVIIHVFCRRGREPTIFRLQNVAKIIMGF
jgi:hypothetical protein